VEYGFISSLFKIYIPPETSLALNYKNLKIYKPAVSTYSKIINSINEH